MEPVIARKQWRTLEPIHGLVYFAPEAAAAYDAIGLQGRSQYFASRSAPMGAVAPEVVVATFFNFNPSVVIDAMTGVWDNRTPADVIAARLQGIEGALRSSIGEALGSADVARAAALARRAAGGCSVTGRALYAGHASLAWPDEPHLVLWHAISLLREYRGDGHVACLVEAGLDGCEALVFHAASGEVPRAALQTTRGWTDEAWHAAVERLAVRGLVDAEGAFTDAGAALRAEIEARTDELALAPWAHLGEADCDELRALGRPLSKAIVEGGSLGALAAAVHTGRRLTAMELRPLRDDDLPEVAALVFRSEQHDNIERKYTLDELREQISVPFIDLETDGRVAMADGALLGWINVWNPPVEEGQDRAYLFGEVDPEYRGKGVGRALVAWGVERATEKQLSRDHDLPRYIRVNAYDWMEANHHLYARFGFEPVQWQDELIRPLTDLPAMQPIEGVVLVPWPDDRDDETLRVRNAAFADHWGYAPLPAESWHQTVRGHGARPDLSVLALDASNHEIVAVCINHAYPEDDELTGRRDAWIENLGTLRAWRGRGIASALLAQSMANFAAAGFTHAMLGVDADSPTGANRLYRSMGFTTRFRAITHQIEVKGR